MLITTTCSVCHVAFCVNPLLSSCRYVFAPLLYPSHSVDKCADLTLLYNWRAVLRCCVCLYLWINLFLFQQLRAPTVNADGFREISRKPAHWTDMTKAHGFVDITYNVSPQTTTVCILSTYIK